ncbi:hypothetical protein FUAX_09870 [Fulvitalea axinellae]|uniref:Uncharacterized protein n=1 Tax=Fulvitalea axinellae TaxID=1182444 RepID=A0AAU9CH40_9BACT|nr:hypothetical protein FUAX_09870 [Fulvitalea axinellae]
MKAFGLNKRITGNAVKPVTAKVYDGTLNYPSIHPKRAEKVPAGHCLLDQDGREWREFVVKASGNFIVEPYRDKEGANYRLFVIPESTVSFHIHWLNQTEKVLVEPGEPFAIDVTVLDAGGTLRHHVNHRIFQDDSESKTHGMSSYEIKKRFREVEETLNSGVVSGANIFVTAVSSPDPSKTVNPAHDPEAVGQNVIKSLVTNADTLNLTAVWDGGKNWTGNLSVNGTAVAQSQISKVSGTHRSFQANITGVDITGKDKIEITVNGGTLEIPIERLAAAPSISGATFGAYPGSQTELKNGDRIPVTLQLDKAGATRIEFANFGAFGAQTINCGSATASVTVSALVNHNHSGNSPANLGLRVRTLDANNAKSDWFEIATGLSCNNLTPGFSFSVAYPTGQTALKDEETATVSNTVSNADTVVYTAPDGQLLFLDSDGSYKSSRNGHAGQLRVKRNSIDYGYATGRITATRDANGKTATRDFDIRIAHTDPQLALIAPPRLRSGGYAGSSAQTHSIRFSANQDIETLTAVIDGDGGELAESVTKLGPNLFQIKIRIDDDVPKGAKNIQVQAVNLAGKIVNKTESYTVGGFVKRSLTVAAFARETAIGTNVTDTSKLRCSNRSKGTADNNFLYKASLADEADRYTITGPSGTHNPNGDTWYNLDEANANNNASGNTVIEIEELI